MHGPGLQRGFKESPLYGRRGRWRAGRETKEAAMTRIVRCSCGAELRDDDEDRLVAIVQQHAREAHNLALSDAQARDMMELEQDPPR